MHIEVWQSPPRIGDQRWHWHFKSKGRTVGDAESFPTKANAIRAAKAVVCAVVKRVELASPPVFAPPVFRVEPIMSDMKRLKITWS